MFYEEKIVSGVMCWRNAPNGEWTAFSLEDMAHKYQEEKSAVAVYTERINRASNLLQGGEAAGRSPS